MDLPGIIDCAKDGKGKRRQVIGVVRACNLILVLLDAVQPLTHKRIIESELEGVGIVIKEGIMINRTINSDERMTDKTITIFARNIN